MNPQIQIQALEFAIKQLRMFERESFVVDDETTYNNYINTIQVLETMKYEIERNM
jgi:hypothetical protein